MLLEKIDANQFEKNIYNNQEPCLVLFSRKNCHVCQGVLAMLEELQPAYQEKLRFYYVDIEEERVLYQSFSLKGVPQILVFNEGEFQSKLSGEVEEEDVIARINTL